MCVLLTFLRLNADNEIIALNASGISLYQMLPPILVFSSFSLFISLFLSIYVLPLGNNAYKNIIYQVVESNTDIPIKERIFYEPFQNDIVFYVNSFSAKERVMKDLFVVDKRGILTTHTIIAKAGKILFDPHLKMVTIRFMDGMLFSVDKNLKSTNAGGFDSYDITINLNELINTMASKKKGPKEMSLNELMVSLKKLKKDTLKYHQMEIELFEMFSIPLAIFLLGIIGAPLGAQVRSRGRPMGIVLSLFIFLVYYISLMSIRYICEMGILTPMMGVWLPDLFLLIICIYLLIKAANDRPIISFGRLFFLKSIT
jgi:lipopolysaccharide export system permease protein